MAQLSDPRCDADGADESADDSAEAVAMRRLRWRMRRGMLENDILLRRVFCAGDAPLPAAEREALGRLLDLPDGELLDLLLGRSTADAAHPADEATTRLVQRLQAA
jgi:antitoxin CptB